MDYNLRYYGFPKGKQNKDETPSQCAVREVFEEIGFDINSIINPLVIIIYIYIYIGIHRDRH